MAETVGAVTVIAAQTRSPVLVALVQAAVSLPALAIALLAGALADVVERRRLLAATAVAMAGVLSVLALVTAAELASPAVVLVLTLALGCGMAVALPAFHALTPELVAPGGMAAAVTLNGVSINAARALGPAAASVLLVVVAPWALFAVLALALAGAWPLLARVRRRERRAASQEPLRSAVAAALRFALDAGPMRAVLVRAGLFGCLASGLWALLPLVAIEQLSMRASAFGLLLACLGVGAVAGAAALARLRAHLSLDALVALGSGTTAVVLAVLATTHSRPLAAGALVVAGMAWIATFATLNTAVHLVSPAAMRARGLALLQAVLQGGLALGSATWGAAAEASSVATTLLVAAAALAVSVLVGRRWPLRAQLDGMPSVAS